MHVNIPATGPLTGPHIDAVVAAITHDVRLQELGTRDPADHIARALQATRFASQPGIAHRLLDAVGADEEAGAIERLGEQGYALGGHIAHRGDLACLAATEVLRERVRRAPETNDTSAELGARSMTRQSAWHEAASLLNRPREQSGRTLVIACDLAPFACVALFGAMAMALPTPLTGILALGTIFATITHGVMRTLMTDIYEEQPPLRNLLWYVVLTAAFSTALGLLNLAA